MKRAEGIMLSLTPVGDAIKCAVTYARVDSGRLARLSVRPSSPMAKNKKYSANTS